MDRDCRWRVKERKTFFNVDDLRAIRDLAEQGRFTPDWLAYRNAQRKHFEEESLLEAYWMYNNIATNYPKTLCAEASECYLIKILALFSNPAVIKEAAKRYDILLDQLEDAKAQWRYSKRTGMAVPFITGLEAYIERLKLVVNMFGKTPFGHKALKETEKRVEIFLEKNKYGLYRGEASLVETELEGSCLGESIGFMRQKAAMDETFGTLLLLSNE